jgi:hypothetical protein
MGNKGAGGVFAPLVVVVRNAVGDKEFNKLRGKAIALHSQGESQNVQRTLQRVVCAGMRCRQQLDVPCIDVGWRQGHLIVARWLGARCRSWPASQGCMYLAHSIHPPYCPFHVTLKRCAWLHTPAPLLSPSWTMLPLTGMKIPDGLSHSATHPPTLVLPLSQSSFKSPTLIHPIPSPARMACCCVMCMLAVIKEFCISVGVDNRQCQGVIRLAKKNGEWLGFLA